MENGIIDPKIYKTGRMKPCPFCARTDMDIIKYQDNVFGVTCKCGAEAPKDSKSISGAVRIWNRRRYEPYKKEK